MKSNPNVKYSLQDKTLQILQNRTQKQAAKVLGVSTRTIRRWKAGHVKKPIPQNKIVLNKRFTNDRRIEIRKGAPKKVKVIPPVRKYADGIVADIKRQREKDIIDFIKNVSDEKTIIRILVKEKKSIDYPSGISSTGWFDFNKNTDKQIGRRLNRIGEPLKIITGVL